MEKNIVEYWMHKGEITEKVADYISVKNFAKAIEALYRECLEDYENSEDIEEYLADFEGFNIQSLAWDFTKKANRDMKEYLHMQNHHMVGNFADIEGDYPAHVSADVRLPRRSIFATPSLHAALGWLSPSRSPRACLSSTKILQPCATLLVEDKLLQA